MVIPQPEVPEHPRQTLLPAILLTFWQQRIMRNSKQEQQHVLLVESVTIRPTKRRILMEEFTKVMMIPIAKASNYVSYLPLDFPIETYKESIHTPHDTLLTD